MLKVYNFPVIIQNSQQNILVKNNVIKNKLQTYQTVEQGFPNVGDFSKLGEGKFKILRNFKTYTRYS